jgi:uncharacterized membrane protein YgdD (TMEM256/DUF423 family)
MKKIPVIAAIFALFGVMLGAFGAHYLKERLLINGMLEVWQTAVFYHLTHSIAAYFITYQRPASEHLGRKAGAAWLIGIFLFSGSLYALSLGGPRWLGPITPLGGIGFVIGWICAIWAAVRTSKLTSAE